MSRALASSSFYLESLRYIPLGQHQSMPLRPYVMNVTDQAVNHLADTMLAQKTRTVTSEMVSSISDQIITPSVIGFEGNVNHTWIAQQRYSFILHVREVDVMGKITNTYVQGFTSHDGITRQGAIDLTMVHTINSVIETVMVESHTPLGIMRKEVLSRIYNVIGNDSWESLYTQRPIDVVENIKTSHIKDFVDSGTMDSWDNGMSLEFQDWDHHVAPSWGDTTIVNVTNSLHKGSSDTLSSSVINNTTSEYLVRSLNAGMHIQGDREIYLGGAMIETEDSVKLSISEPSIGSNMFLRYLGKLSGYNCSMQTFNFNALLEMDKTIYDRFEFIEKKQVLRAQNSHAPEVGEHWLGQDMLTLKAYSLLESSVSQVTGNGFNKLEFIATNMNNPMGRMEVSILNFHGFIHLDETSTKYLLDRFCRYMEHSVLIPETSGGAVPIFIEVHIDLLSTSRINIQYDNQGPVWFTAPTVANSGYAPVVTNDTGTIDVIGEQVANLANYVSEGTMRQNRRSFVSGDRLY